LVLRNIAPLFGSLVDQLLSRFIPDPSLPAVGVHAHCGVHDISIGWVGGDSLDSPIVPGPILALVAVRKPLGIPCRVVGKVGQGRPGVVRVQSVESTYIGPGICNALRAGVENDPRSETSATSGVGILPCRKLGFRMASTSWHLTCIGISQGDDGSKRRRRCKTHVCGGLEEGMALHMTRT
jgi:hypothetical protein